MALCQKNCEIDFRRDTMHDQQLTLCCHSSDLNRKAALALLIDALTRVAQSAGNKFTYALIKHDGLIKTYEELGYIQGDSYNKEMIKVL